MTNNDAPYQNPLSNPDAPMEVPLEIVIDNIDFKNVIKTPSVKTGDTGKFHIPILQDGVTHIIVVSTSQILAGPKKFTTIFADVFGKRLIVLKNDNQWNKFIDWLMSIAIPGTPDESAAVMAGQLLFEKIATAWEVTADKSYITKRENCNRFVEHAPHGEMWYVVPSAAMMELISELPINTSQEDVSQAMTACGYKKANTEPVRPKGEKTVRCWWLNVDKLREINPDLGGGR